MGERIAKRRDSAENMRARRSPREHLTYLRFEYPPRHQIPDFNAP
jgi:hypothetical protein